MNTKEMERLFMKAFEDNSVKLISWANIKLSSKEDVEELCQEVMKRLYISIQKKNLSGEKFRNINNYLWKIAFSVLSDFRKHSKEERILLKLFCHEAPISTEDIETSDNLYNYFMNKVNRAIMMLNSRHRDVMNMYYLERKDKKLISERLNITVNYLKKLLHESKEIIRNQDKLMLYDTEFNFRPVNLYMSYSGEMIDLPDFLVVLNSLSKQNICRVCFYEPKTIDEIAKELEIPKIYIEFDLKWLLKKEFINKRKNRFYTTFFIIDGDLQTLITNIYMKYKKDCLDTIIEKIISKQKEIKRIGFVGCHKPIESMLWFLIYSFTDFASDLFCIEKFNFKDESLNRADGGKYYPIGAYDSESETAISPLYTEKYHDLEDWNCYGTYSFRDEDSSLSWLGLSGNKQGNSNKFSFKSLTPDVFLHKDILFKAMDKDFIQNDLSDDDKFRLSQLIELGYITVVNEKVLPNFYVFSPKQKKALNDILNNILTEIKPIYKKLFDDIHKTCKSYLPIQLDYLLGYVTHYFLNQCHRYTYGTAYIDGKIYKPETDNEWAVLTTCMVYDGKEIDVNKKYSLIFNLVLN